MSLNLDLSQSLQLRQSMEVRLETSMTIKQTLELTLTLYKSREKICTHLYREALNRGNVRLYKKHDMVFEYAVVSEKDVPRHILNQYGFAFSHCLFNPLDCLIGGEKYALAKGSWLLFVVNDTYADMPNSVIEYSAVHEHGEMVTLGDHNLASKLEFAIAAREKRLRWYINWIEQNEPSKFADVFHYQVHFTTPPEEELGDVLKVFQSSDEAQLVLEMMEDFEWPYSILQKLNKYENANETIKHILNRAFLEAHKLAGDAVLPLQDMVGKIEAILARGFHEIDDLKLRRYVSVVLHEDFWEIERTQLNRIFVEMLQRRKGLIGQSNLIDELNSAKITGDLPDRGRLARGFVQALQ